MIIYEGHLFHDMTVTEGNLYIADVLRGEDVIESNQYEFLIEIATDDDMEFADELNRMLESNDLICEFYNDGQSCVIGRIESVTEFLGGNAA